MEDSSKVFAIGNIEQVAVADGTVDARRATGSSSAEYLRQLSMSQRSNGVFINDPKGLFILRWYREVKGDGTPPDGLRYQSEQSVQVLQADERQRLGGLPLDQQLPDHQQGVPEEALHPASLLFSQCGRQEDGDVHHEKDGGTGGRVEARVCMCSRVLLVSS